MSNGLQQKIQERMAMQQQGIDAQRAQIQQLGQKPQQMDLSALMALTDTWTGSNLAKNYQKPETQQERAYKQAQLEQGLQRQEMGLIDDEIKMLGMLDKQKKEEAKAAKGPKLTSDQWKVATFGKRMDDSNKQLETLFSKDEFDPTSWGQGIERMLPSSVQEEDTKIQEQAERNFINATLRRESGAAIAPSEFDSAELQYFPRVGDTESVLKQKAENRARVIEGFKLESGEAWNKFSDGDYDSMSDDEITKAYNEKMGIK
tara:strand:+ start:3744 stop:4523 length:780 start_codon:yes stop_codon:yes gene_type:complete